MKKEVTKHGFQSWTSEEETITGRKYKNSKSMPSLEKVSMRDESWRQSMENYRFGRR